MMRISKPPHERKAEILQAALALFMEHGYEGTSISMIVQDVGVAQGLFYYYFKSKEDVFAAATEYYVEHLLLAVSSKLLAPEPLSFAERLEEVMATLLEMVHTSEGPLSRSLPGIDFSDMEIRLSYHFSQMMIQPFALFLRLLSDQSQYNLVCDAHTAASFIVFGIFGLLHRVDAPGHNADVLQSDVLIPILAATLGIPKKILLTCKIVVPEEICL